MNEIKSEQKKKRGESGEPKDQPRGNAVHEKTQPGKGEK